MLSTNRPSTALLSSVERSSQPLEAADLLARLPSVRITAAPDAEPITLSSAYRTCERITRLHSKSFYFSSQLLPREKQLAIRALYALCRTSDDIVDTPQENPALALAHWVAQVRNPQPPAQSHVLQAWNDTRQRYAIPQVLVEELLAGITMDLSISRYETFDELWLYCYRVASVVGLLAMQIIGYEPGAAPYAIKLGIALQLTNILRDVGEDARRNRIYLPQEDLQRFRVTDDDILDGRIDQRYIALMRYEMRRAEQLYVEAQPGIALLSADSRLAIAAAAEIYRAILGKIQANQYDNITRRARVPFREKLTILWQLYRAY